MVLRAVEADSVDARMALESLCREYWYPLYAFVRQKGFKPEVAEDLTQAFFAFLFEKNSLAKADQSRGRFRTFLLHCLTNFLNNQWREAQAQKRGGNLQIFALDFEHGESRYQGEPYHDLTPERIFDRSWAITLLGNVFDDLRQYYTERSQGELFQALKPHLIGEGPTSYHELANGLNMSEGALRVAVHRMRDRCKDVLRKRILETVDSSAEIDDEIRDLFNTLTS